MKRAQRFATILLSMICVVGVAVLLNATSVRSLNDTREDNWTFTVNDVVLDSAERADVEVVEDEQPILLHSDSGGSYAANRVLMSFDGSMDEEELTAYLSEKNVQTSEVSLVSNSLDNDEVLVVVEYLGEEDPLDLSERLAADSVISVSEPDYVMSVDDVEDMVRLYPSDEVDASGEESFDADVTEGTVDSSEPAAEDHLLNSESVDTANSAEDEASETFVAPDSYEEALASGSSSFFANDVVFSPDATVNDSYFSQQWEIKAARLTNAWDYVKSSGTVTVAVVDTGVNCNHTDLVNNLVPSSYFKNTYTGSTGLYAVKDERDHGTHVAGIIAAQANNGKGVAGVSYNAKILPIKVSHNADGQMYTSSIISAIDYVVSLKNNPNSPASLRNLRVINMSLGGFGSSGESFQNAIDRATEAGILCVASAGNDSSYSSAYYPAAYDGVLAVSALKKTSTGAGYAFDSEYSNYGPYVDIAAPGTSIYSTVASGSYKTKSGTSMAAPVVSGAAALMYAQNMNLKPANVTWLLEATAVDLGASGRDDKTGEGALDAYVAAYNRPIAYCTFSSIPDQAYTGSAVKPKLTVKYGNTTLVEGTDYTLSYSNNVNVGKGTVIITGKGRSGGSAKVTFNIRKKADMSNVSFNSATFTYDGNPHYLTVSGNLPSGVSTSYQNNGKVNVGKYTVIARFYADPSVYLPISDMGALLTIEPASVLGGWLYTVEDQFYTGKSVEPSVEFYYDDMLLTEGVDYRLSYEDNVEIGRAAIKIEGMGNYTGSGWTYFDIISQCYAFSDTPDTAWYVTNGTLDYIVSKGIMSGMPDGSFEPGGQVTRAQVATILYQLAGKPSVTKPAGSFVDVQPGSWYYQAVRWAQSENIISGYGQGRFGPEDLVTREQFARMLYGFAEYEGALTSYDSTKAMRMTDWNKVSSWAQGSVAWAVDAGILSGYQNADGSYSLKPGGNATRAEAAQMVRSFDSNF